jgi:ligand-binding sensor domain-containing protein/two-component sensor histidine kinase
MIRKCLFIVGFIFTILFCFAQEYKKAFLRITAEDGLGLSSNNIVSLYQDKTGFIWVGTGNGLQRFDGAKFVHYATEKPGSEKMPLEEIRQITGTADNKIMMLFEQTSTVGLFDPVKVIYRNVPIVTSGKTPPRSEYTLWTDSRNNVYLNVLRYGKILQFDEEKFEFNENTPLNNLPKGWKTTSTIFEDTLLNRYWIVADSGLCIYDIKSGQTWSRNHNPKKIRLLEKYESHQEVSEFFIDQQRRHWYFYWTGAQHFNCFDEQGNPLPDTAGLAGVNTGYAELRKFTETSNGNLWIYGPGCLFTLNNDQHKFNFYRNQYTDNYNIRYESVNHVIEDRDGMIWIATDQGLYYHSPRRKQVTNIFLSDVPGALEVTDLLQINTGEYWISTWGEGVASIDSTFNSYDAGIYTYKPKEFLDNQIMYRQVWTMLQHSSGKVFLGCQGGRLMIFDPVTKKNIYLNPPEFENRTIRFITEDKKGNVWFGTQSGAVIRYDGKAFKVIYKLEETAIIYKLYMDKENGWIWLATHERGLYALNPSTGNIEMHYSRANPKWPLHGDRVTDIEQLNDSILYAAASGIIHVINKRSGKVTQLNMENGLPSNTATRIRLDAKGYLWIITQKGLCHYDWRKERFTSFGQKDGIFLGSLVAACDIIDKNQHILFAGPNSLLAFHPDVFYNAQKPSSVVITDFKLLNQNLPVDSLQLLPLIRLQPGENSFDIYFSTLSYRNRGQQTYYYQLVGVDKDWIKSDGSQSALYRLLPPGKYIFKVRVENLDGLANEKITTMNILVKPHFWQTGWFFSLLLTVLAMIGYGIHRLRLNRILAIEKIRARVSRDLHDDMGSTLSTINILSSMAKAKLSTDLAKTASYLGKISDNSQRMMEAMDDIVWAIKPDNDTMQKLIARMREFATSVLEAKDIIIDFVADDLLNDLKPDMEYRRDLFLLFKEAVNNTAKYSKSTKVIIRISIENRRLVMVVSDNGTGFDIKNADSGNGLGNMNRRARALQGHLSIQSEQGMGTTITLNAHLTI